MLWTDLAKACLRLNATISSTEHESRAGSEAHGCQGLVQGACLPLNAHLLLATHCRRQELLATHCWRQELLATHCGYQELLATHCCAGRSSRTRSALETPGPPVPPEHMQRGSAASGAQVQGSDDMLWARHKCSALTTCASLQKSNKPQHT